MKVYVAFRKDYEHRKGELLGMLVEKRNDARGLTQWESGLKWARGAFGHLVKDKKSIFVFPKELKVSEDKKLDVEEHGLYCAAVLSRQQDEWAPIPARQIGRIDIGDRPLQLDALLQEITHGGEHAGVDGLVGLVVGQLKADGVA